MDVCPRMCCLLVPGRLHFQKELKEDNILQLPSQLDGDMAMFADLS